MKTFTFHHGSPGRPEDVKQLMPLEKTFLIKSLNRYKNEQSQSDIQCGYSFGCVEALKQAINNGAEEVFLISPFVFPKKSPSLIAKTLLKAPIIGNQVVGLMAKKAIDKLVQDSSSPASIPSEYLNDAQYYKKPALLKKAVLEKDYDQKQLKELLKKSKIKITAIIGDQDQSAKDQCDQLKQLCPLDIKVIKQAGHALPWTHQQQLCELIQGQKTNTDSKPYGYHQGESAKNNVCSFLEKHLEQCPERPILSWIHPEKIKQWDFNLETTLAHDSVTVKQLDEMVARIGAGLKKLGLAKGDRVIIFIPMSLYLYAAMFAVQKIGAIAVFLDSWARRDQLGQSADVVSPKMIISVEQAFAYLKEVPEIANIALKVVAGPTTNSYSAHLEALMQTPELCQTEPVASEHTALVTFTTGSSGTPKGANRTHRFLAAQHYALNRHLPYETSDADLPVFPIFSLNNLAAGVKTVIPAIDVGSPAQHDAAVLIAQMKSTNTTCTTLSPSLLNAVSAFCLQNNLELPFLRRIITGGAPVSKDDVVKIKKACPNAEVLVLYGSTEVEPMAHIEGQEMIDQVQSDDPEWVEEGVNVGHMDEGLSVKFLKINKDPIFIQQEKDWDLHTVSKGSVGEIIVAGEHVCESYYNNEEAFFRAKIRDQDGKVWHRTGDLGKLDEHGQLWLVGRVHNAIKRADEYSFPVRSEIIMKKCDFVDKCAYLGVADSALGEKTVCVFTTKQPEVDENRLNEMKSEIQRLMEKNKVKVDQIILTDQIPMDPRHHSKVEYTLLREDLRAKGKLSIQ